MPNYNDAQGVADLLSQCQIRATRSRPSPRLPKRAARHRASSNRTVMTGRRPSVRMSVPMGTLSIR